jgi:hypothetical protein
VCGFAIAVNLYQSTANSSIRFDSPRLASSGVAGVFAALLSPDAAMTERDDPYWRLRSSTWSLPSTLVTATGLTPIRGGQ